MQPKFSVIVPAYNEEAYLPRCLAAIRKAEEKLGEPVEIVVGDNLSTDGTARVAAEFGARMGFSDFYLFLQAGLQDIGWP